MTQDADTPNRLKHNHATQAGDSDLTYANESPIFIAIPRTSLKLNETVVMPSRNYQNQNKIDFGDDENRLQSR